MLNDLDRPYIIAEISGNHNGSFDRAKELIKAAKENGADCVKLQTYTPDTMTIKSNKEDFQITTGLWEGYNLWDLYDWAQTPFEWQEDLFKFAKNLGITCISTPFDETAVNLLESLDCPFYKIASFELTDLPLVKYVAQTNKPLILSTGMANHEEISDAIEVIKEYGCGDYVVLHCVSGYPTPVEQINLNTIQLLKESFQCEIGLSDHTLGNESALIAIAYGAKVIEKHFTLSREDGGPDADFSMEPKELRDLCKKASLVHKSLGRASFEKKEVEVENIKFRRSIYFTQDLKKGDEININNVRRIRPGYGLAPKYFNEILGKRVKCDIERGTAMSWDHIE